MPVVRSLDDLTVARLLLQAQRGVAAEARGTSMSPTLPSGTTIRIRRVPDERLRAGCVVAVAPAGTVITHRIVRRGRGPVARNFVITRGDGRTLCDDPVAVRDVLGAVTEYYADTGWRELEEKSPHRDGWRRWAAAGLDAAAGLALEVDVKLARGVSRAARRAAAAWSRLRGRAWPR